jgi:hypothetical protein
MAKVKRKKKKPYWYHIITVGPKAPRMCWHESKRAADRHKR